MPPGRPRLYADNASRQRAYRQRCAAQKARQAALLPLVFPHHPGECWDAILDRIAAHLRALVPPPANDPARPVPVRPPDTL